MFLLRFLALSPSPPLYLSGFMYIFAYISKMWAEIIEKIAKTYSKQKS